MCMCSCTQVHVGSPQRQLSCKRPTLKRQTCAHCHMHKLNWWESACAEAKQGSPTGCFSDHSKLGWWAQSWTQQNIRHNLAIETCGTTWVRNACMQTKAGFGFIGVIGWRWYLPVRLYCVPVCLQSHERWVAVWTRVRDDAPAETLLRFTGGGRTTLASL